MRSVKKSIQEEPSEPRQAKSVALAERPPKLSRRERRKIATRDALLTAAQEVIAVKGVYLAVIEEITERADVAKGSFYQYFEDRDDLLHVILSRRLQELRATIEATAAPRTLVERAQVLIRHHLDYLLNNEDFLLFLHQIRGLIKMKGNETPAVRDTYQRYLQFLAEWLQPQDTKVRANGKVREENACALLGFLTGFLSHYAVLTPLTDLAQGKARIETALTNACVAFWQH
jgi:AcrR family transcriptional regulator